jgi:hypothetical protein
MIDENAFGLLVSYFAVEDDEYSGERADFVARYGEFTGVVQSHLSEHAPGAAARALDLGHAIYVELLEDEEHVELIGWLRQLRGALSERAFQSAGILTFGSTWVDETAPRPDTLACGSITLCRASLPSEPLRRALRAEVETHADEEAGRPGWGPGLYLDTDAVEALGRKPKNEPTVLQCGEARFYRAGS